MSKSSPVAITTNLRTNFAIVNAPGSWSAISAGSNNSLAVNSTGTLFAWGAGVGTGDVVLTNYSKVSEGVGFALALTPNGALYATGINSSGQLGDGTTINKSSPVKIGSESWSQISAGWSHAGAIHSNGALYMWGLNSAGQLGNDDITATPVNRSSPIQIGNRSWSFLSVGNNHTAAVTTNGEIFVWGNNWAGQIGDGSVIGLRNSGGWDTFTLGGNRSGIIAEKDSTSGANLFAWGTSVIGDGTTTARISPTAVSTSISNWNYVADGVSGSHYAAISSNGALYTWGINANGQLGDGTTVNKSSPVKIGSESWTRVAVAGSHTIGVLANGALYVWGVNTGGQLGDGTTVPKSSPVKIGSESWTEVAGGSLNSYAIRNDGTLYSWGSATNGMLGNNEDILVNRSSPVQVAGSWSKITCSDSHVFAVNSTGSLFGWGNNSIGQVGIQSGESFALKKTTSWSKIAVGAFGIAASGGTMLATNSTGILFGWGINNNGVIGDGTTINKSSPVQIGSQSWQFIACGGFAPSAAIHSNGALFMWGPNSLGQLGDGTTVGKSSPVKIGSESWSLVSINGSHCVGILANGALYAWGSGVSGILGDGTTVSKSSPVKIGAQSWLTVAAGLNHSVGVLSNGALYVWGLGTSGQIGDGTSVSKSSPVKIGASSWTSVAAGVDFSVGTTSANVAFAWGLGAGGQLGFSATAANRSSPVAVAGALTTFVRPNKVFAGMSHAAALDSTNGTVYIWGQGSSGQLGQATGRGTVQSATQRNTPVTASNFGAPVIDCFSAGERSLTSQAPAIGFVRADGSYWIWGNNGASGLFGDGLTTLTTRTVPEYTTTTLGSYDWVAGSMREQGGTAFGIRRVNNGELFSWGRGTSGVLGIGATTNRSSPVSVGNAGGIGYSSVAAGSLTAAAIDKNGGLWTWGRGTNGELGNGAALSTSTPGKVGSESWAMVSVASYALGIHANGALFTWGANPYGELGDGTTVPKSSPVKIGSDSWKFVYAGGYAAYAIRSDGALFAWGRNDRNGCLGDGTTVNKSSPVKIGNSSWKFVRASAENTADSPMSAAGITQDGRLFVWGFMTGGTSINNAITDRVAHEYYKVDQSSPVQIGTRTDWEKVAFWGAAAGINQRGMIAIASGELYSWGGINFNLIGDGAGVSRSSPVLIMGGNGDKISHLSLGGFNSAGVTANGLLYTWGLGLNGTLGMEDSISRSSPTQIATAFYIISPTLITSGRTDAIGLSWNLVRAGATHAVALDSSNTIWAWGLNSSGQLGQGATASRQKPLNLIADFSVGAYPTSWNIVKATADGTVAVTSANIIYAWGASTNLGDGTAVNKSSPILLGGSTIRCSPIKIGASSWSQVSVSNNFTMAIRNDGALFGWGFNQSGYPHIGDQSAASKSSPVLVAGTPGTLSWIAVSAGHTHSLAITNTGGMYAWGNNRFGMCGVGTVIAGTTNILFSPAQIGSSSWTAVAAGASVSAAIDSLGRMFTFGEGTTGQLGIGATVVGRSSPVIIAANGFTSVSAGLSTVAAIQNNEDLFVWGLNSTGQFGNGTTINRSSPVFLDYSLKASNYFALTPKVLDSNIQWRKVSAGVDNFAATANANNVLYVWGLNSMTASRLGVNDAYLQQPSPTTGAIATANISMGNVHSALIQTL
jgi:alpha-tubulin suppressor-like RCC1 family protein